MKNKPSKMSQDIEKELGMLIFKLVEGTISEDTGFKRIKSLFSTAVADIIGEDIIIIRKHLEIKQKLTTDQYKEELRVRDEINRTKKQQRQRKTRWFE